MAVIRFLLVMALLSSVGIAPEGPREPEPGPRMDGSTAGYNAVKIESLEGAEIV